MEADRSDILLYTFNCPEDRVNEAQEILSFESIENPSHRFSIPPTDIQLDHGKITVIGMGTAGSVLSALHNLEENNFPTDEAFQWMSFPDILDA
ncbi:MAG TPA: hypothetical protein PLD54_03520 [Candidatus Levybacteria bacterium]|nr:hypothetical protein [Candidatus Levybacteria bacterium]